MGFVDEHDAVGEIFKNAVVADWAVVGKHRADYTGRDWPLQAIGQAWPAASPLALLSRRSASVWAARTSLTDRELRYPRAARHFEQVDGGLPAILAGLRPRRRRGRWRGGVSSSSRRSGAGGVRSPTTGPTRRWGAGDAAYCSQMASAARGTSPRRSRKAGRPTRIPPSSAAARPRHSPGGSHLVDDLQHVDR